MEFTIYWQEIITQIESHYFLFKFWSHVLFSYSSSVNVVTNHFKSTKTFWGLLPNTLLYRKNNFKIQLSDVSEADKVKFYNQKKTIPVCYLTSWNVFLILANKKKLFQWNHCYKKKAVYIQMRYICLNCHYILRWDAFKYKRSEYYKYKYSNI